MRITLIKPGMGDIIKGYNINDGRMEPLQLAIIAGLCGPDNDVKLYDDRMESIPYDEPTDLVGISVDSFNARRSYQIATEYRQREVPVVLGGIHTSILPDEAAQHADAIVIGDAETVWEQVLIDAQTNTLKPLYQGTFATPQSGIQPRRDLYKGKGYLPVSLVQFSRGCKYNCTFCSVSKFFNKSYECRKIDEVIAEIETNKLKTILFVDDNMIQNKAYLKQFLRELAPLKVRWASQASIDMTNDLELMQLMSDSGCVGNLIGFESIDELALRSFNKSPNLSESGKYTKALQILRDYGMLTWASFMLGNDFDDKYSIERTVEFAIKNKFTLAFFHVLMPYPGTKIYEQFNIEKRLLFDGRWWNHPDFRYNAATFIPKKMSPDELQAAAVKANKDFYSYTAIAKRAFDFNTNMRNPANLLIYAHFNRILKSTST